jgi:hypothetical protein
VIAAVTKIGATTENRNSVPPVVRWTKSRPESIATRVRLSDTIERVRMVRDERS